jgi:hypothetical protein
LRKTKANDKYAYLYVMYDPQEKEPWYHRNARSVRKSWEDYASVAHLCAAFRFLALERHRNRQKPAASRVGERLLRYIEANIGRFIDIAAGYQAFLTEPQATRQGAKKNKGSRTAVVPVERLLALPPHLLRSPAMPNVEALGQDDEERLWNKA